MGPKMRLRSGLKLLGIDLMVSNQIIFTFHSICSVYSVHMHHLGVTLHCVIRIGRGWGNHRGLMKGRDLRRTDMLWLYHHLSLNMLMFIIYMYSYFHFLFTAAGMADPLHGAWAERPAEISVLQCGVKCSGSTGYSPGPANQRKAIS